MEQVAAQTEVQTVRIAAQVTQQLVKDIEAATTSMATTAEITTRVAVEGVRCNVQAQFEQTPADSQ